MNQLTVCVKACQTLKQKLNIAFKSKAIFLKLENLLICFVVHPPTLMYTTHFSGKFLVFCNGFDWTARRNYLTRV